MIVPNYHICFPNNYPREAPANSLSFYVDAISSSLSPLLQEAQARRMFNELFASAHGTFAGMLTSPIVERSGFMWRSATLVQRDAVYERGYNYVGRFGSDSFVQSCVLTNRISLYDIQYLAFMLDNLKSTAITHGDKIVHHPVEHARDIIRHCFDSRQRDMVQRYAHSQQSIVLRDAELTDGCLDFELLFQPHLSQFAHSIAIKYFVFAQRCDMSITADNVIAESLFNLYGMRVEVKDVTTI